MLNIDKSIEILLNKNYSNNAIRDDIAMELKYSDNPQVLDALVKISMDHNEEYIILSSAGESIGVIMSRTSNCNMAYLNKIHPIALREALSAIAVEHPEWWDKFPLDELSKKRWHEYKQTDEYKMRLKLFKGKR